MNVSLVRIADVVDRVETVDPGARPGVPFTYIDISSVDNLTKVITEPRRLRGRDAPSRARQQVRANDVLVATTRPYLNAVAMVGADLDGQVCSTGFAVLRANESVDAGYLFMFVQSQAFIQPLAGLVQGALYPAVSNRDVLAQRIPLPELAEQRRIAADLFAQLRAVDLARAAATERSAKREQLLEECLANRILTRSDSGWTEAHLRDAVHIQLGKMLSPASKTGTRPVPYLRNANVQWDRFALSDVYQMDFTEAEERKFRLAPGDVLVCEGGQPGRAAIWAGQIERCCYQKSLHRLRPIAQAVDPRFLMYRLWLGALRGEFVDNHSATTIAHLPAVRLAGLKVRLPSLREQQRIAAELREQIAVIDAMEAAIQAEREAIDALPAALLRRAFEDLAA